MYHRQTTLIRRYSSLLLFTLLLCLPSISGRCAAVDPLGATPHSGFTTFRVWAPFVDAVSVKINGVPVPMQKEDGHPDAADTVWTAQVPGAKPGDRYTYSIRLQGNTSDFVDPRSQQLTPDNTASVIVDPAFSMPAFTTPSFNEMVIYELHIGTFHPSTPDHKYDFAGAAEELGYLKKLGINAVEVMPIHQNAVQNGHTPQDFDWGYDAIQLFAVNSPYGTPQQFKQFVKQCHACGIAVILDVVYNHLSGDNLLKKFGGVSLDAIKDGIYFYGDAREDTGFGPRPDYGRPQVRSYITDNALMWLRDYDVDGLRWDSVVNIRGYSENNQFHSNPEGRQLLEESNDSYRNTDPKQPQKISIAEDLQSSSDIVLPTSMGDLGFNSQWDEGLYFALKNAVTAVLDDQRNLQPIADSLNLQFNGDVFSRVIYSENHDKVGHPPDQIRLPRLIDGNDPESVFAQKRSTLAAAIVLTAPGIPMLFQGQEMLDTNTFLFGTATPVDWSRTTKFAGIVQMYHDLIALRRNIAHHTAGLTLQKVNVFHVDNGNKTLAYHRYGNGGPGDDVVVVANFSNNRLDNLNIGFPRGGRWVVRFNSGAQIYDPAFTNGDSFDAVAQPGAKDGLNFNGNVGIGPYSVVIFSQD